MIDYQSTDKSVEIIKEICPNWKIVKSRNTDFGAMNVDLEVEHYENQLEGWRMCLNVTEFLYGDMSQLHSERDPTRFIVPSLMFVSKERATYYSHEIELTEHVKTAIPYSVHDERVGRSLHNFPINYPKPGRHFFTPHLYTDKFLIFHYGWAPMCPDLLKRKLQIQTRIPAYDRENRLGFHHITNETTLLNKWQLEYIPKAMDCSSVIPFWKELTEGKRNTILDLNSI